MVTQLAALRVVCFVVVQYLVKIDALVRDWAADVEGMVSAEVAIGLLACQVRLLYPTTTATAQ